MADHPDNVKQEQKHFGCVSHSFNADIASKYGVPEAIIIQYIAYWIDFNIRTGKNQHDGHTWMYETRKDMSAHFPYFSPDQIRRITDKLVIKGVLIKGNFNKTAIDKTIWYAFKNQKMFTTAESASGGDQCARAIPVPKTVIKKKNYYKKKKFSETNGPPVVVVFPCLDDLDISDYLKEEISRKHPEEEVKTAVKRTLSWSSRLNDETGIHTTLDRKDTWDDTPSKEQRIEANAAYLKTLEHHDGTKIARSDVTIGNNYILFSKGQGCVSFSIKECGFIPKVATYITNLRALRV